MNTLIALLPVLHEGTPNTVPYLILGYAIIGAVGIGYVVTLLWRQRGLLREIEILEMLDKDEPS